MSDPRTLYNKDINYKIFGSAEDIDRIISIANSSLIHRDMIKEFDLINHYELDSDNPADSNIVMEFTLEEFRSNFDFIKNDEGALEITIHDTDKELAAEMVKIMTGNRKIVAPAATAGQSNPPIPMIVGMNGGAVCAVAEVSKTANAYSFQAKIRQKIAVEAMPVAACGRTTL